MRVRFKIIASWLMAEENLLLHHNILRLIRITRHQGPPRRHAPDLGLLFSSLMNLYS
jgi:hypothetical protein